MDIIDSFVVELGLDPKKYQDESKKFRDDLKRLREDARRTARDTESDAKHATEYFGKLKSEILGVVAAVAGARTLGGLISDMVTGAAATGRLAHNLGIATDQVSAWEGAVRSMGGTAQDAQSALAMLNGEFQTYRLTGSMPHGGDFNALGIPLSTVNDPQALMMALAERSEHMGRPEFVARMQRIGLPDSVINTLARGRDGVRALLEEQRRLGVVTERDAQAAIEFERQWANLTTRLRGDLRPELTWLLEQGLPLLETHAGEAGAAVAGIAVGVAALTANLWLLPAAIGAVAVAFDRAAHGQLDVLQWVVGGTQWAQRQILQGQIFLQEQLLSRTTDPAARAQTEQRLTEMRARLAQYDAPTAGPATPGATMGPWGPLAPTAGGGTSGPFSAVAARIRATEGGAAGYNAVVYGIRSPRPPTTMTLGEVYAYQRGALRAQTRGRRGAGDIGSTGMGAYQFESQTMRAMAVALFGANWQSQQFSAANQDRLAQALYAREGLRPWAIGQRGAARLPGGGARLAARGGAGGGAPVTIGSIVVYTPHGTTGAQAEAVARAIPRAVARRNVTTQANTGLR